jgi:predicted nucleic acid-binding protein
VTTTQFVDTNIILRYLTKDDPQKASACLALFQKAQQNRVRLTTSESVIAETVYLLSSKKVYRLQPQEVKRRLAPLLLRALRIEHKDTIITALDLYGAYHMDFEDCLTVAHMERQKLKEIYSYDQDFDQVEHIQRREP